MKTSFILLLSSFCTFGCSAPDKEGEGLVDLPVEAQVLEVRRGEWAGDFVVVFRLPPDKTPEAWLEQVWQMNLHRKVCLDMQEPEKRENRIFARCFGCAWKGVAYLPDTGVYEYQERLEK